MFNPFKAFKSQAPATTRPSPPSPAAASVRDALVPRIKHLAFERHLRGVGMPPEQLPLFEPLVGELLVTYAFDMPDQFVMANPTNLERAGIAPGEARALACANLTARMPKITIERQKGALLVVTGGDWEACLLLLDGLWSGAQARFEPGSVVCAPRRNRLLVSDGSGTDSVAALRSAAASYFAEHDDGHALSVQLMTRQGPIWQLLAQ